MTVNAACPASNDTAAGANPATRTARGSRIQRSVVLVPISATIAPPTTTPAAVPARPRTTLWPVLSAFERSTESVPSTTQNEC